ncbi:MAG TPA: hypothetical protein VE991_12765, partial [Acidimicrobiales bacterium]|nr:hypothetical protein [Acidimicrobiales bacterium]
GRPNVGTLVAEPDRWRLTDADVLGWLAASPLTPLGRHAADFTRALETIEAVLPGSPLVAALARALGAPQPEGRFATIPPGPATPYEVSVCTAEDDTPLIEIETYPGVHAKDEQPYARVYLNDERIYDVSLPAPEPHPDGGVIVPADRWLAARADGEHPELSEQLRRALRLNDEPHIPAALGVQTLIWASRFGAVCAADSTTRPSALDEMVYVTTFTHPQHGRAAAVVRVPETGEITAAVYESRADDATWATFDHYFVTCHAGHHFEHRAGLVTGEGMDGVPVEQAGGRPDTWGELCPRCEAEVKLTAHGF